MEPVYINNHIHTVYSFSPYTPTTAVEAAKKSGLATAGIMDHDTTLGSKEFVEAGKKYDMPITCGCETRVDMSKTPLAGKRINNPDQLSCAYVAMHGIPHQYFDAVDDFFKPRRAKRNERNARMCENISKITAPYGFTLDFESDVLPLATATVTERHILYALTKKITAKYKTPEEVLEFLTGSFGLNVSGKVHDNIAAGRETPDFYEYDILGVLKSNLVEKFYVDATDELPDVTEFIDMVHTYGGIAAYAYLGDVGNSVTGDKKAQKFEDDYIDLLFDTIRDLGFDAVTYMPSRNTLEQLDRVIKMCGDYGFFQISGEDINTPRQSFICKQYEDPRFAHLVKAAFTLIDYENAASENLEKAREDFSFIFRK